MELPLNIEDLLSGRTIETDRIEFKKGWNPDRIYQTICAFANDFDNSGGGYILIGIEEENKVAKRPVEGLQIEEIALIQEKMIGFNNLIRPVYHPKLFIEEIDGKPIIVLWIPGGSERPYEVPDYVTKGKVNYNYRIRKYSNSIVPDIHERNELINLSNQVPFDDRPNTNAGIEDISEVLVENYLKTVDSKISGLKTRRSFIEILSSMDLLSGPEENRFPRNVALMLFSDLPEKFFPYSRIEIVHFPDDADSNEFIEIPPITGPVQSQITDALNYLRTNVLAEKTIKIPGESKSVRISNYPFQAMEEAIANAIYHRDYNAREPVEIRIYPDSIVILNYGGPDRSIKMQSFDKGIVKARRYRNRRLGDFLKELHLTEGRATGIPMIKRSLSENGSPKAYFETDEDRTYFMVEFKIHPVFTEILIPVELLLPVLPGDINKLINWITDTYLYKFKSNESSTEVNELINNQIELLEHTDNTFGTEVSTEVNDLINSFIESLESNNVDFSTEVGNEADPGSTNKYKEAILSVMNEILNDRIVAILNVCKIPLTLGDLFRKVGLSKQTKYVTNYIKPLIRLQWLIPTIPSKKQSPKQSYVTTFTGKMIISLYNALKVTE